MQLWKRCRKRPSISILAQPLPSSTPTLQFLDKICTSLVLPIQHLQTEGLILTLPTSPSSVSPTVVKKHHPPSCCSWPNPQLSPSYPVSHQNLLGVSISPYCLCLTLQLHCHHPSLGLYPLWTSSFTLTGLPESLLASLPRCTTTHSSQRSF